MSKKTVLLGPYPPPYGGVSIYIKTLFEFIRTRDVELWTYGEQEITGHNVYFMKDRRLQIVPLLLRRGWGTRIVDCTHFLVEYPSLLLPLWILLKKLLGFEWIKIVQDGSLPARYEGFSWFQKLLFSLSIKSVSEFIVISEDLEEWFHRDMRVSKQVSLIKNLLPISYTEAESALPEELIKILQPYFNRAKLLCSIGVFIQSYGFKQIADAVEEVRLQSGIDVGLLLFDGAFAVDERYKSSVLGERDWITVLKNVPHPLLFQILKSSDLFVRGVSLEGYGLSRVEALWCGLPVVATKVGETRGCLLYDFDNQDQLVEQIKSALISPNNENVERWASHFKQEAEENMKMLLMKLEIKNEV